MEELNEKALSIYGQWCNDESTNDSTLVSRTIDTLVEISEYTQDERYDTLARQIASGQYFDDEITGLLGEFLS